MHANIPAASPPPCRLSSNHSTAPAPNSVAVLYFDNLSADTADAYLAEGLTEELIARLGQLPRLAVKSRAAVRRFPPSGAGPPAAPRAPRRARLVPRGVRRAGERPPGARGIVRASRGGPGWGRPFAR